MSRPDRLKRQPTANTTPQSTPSFHPIDPEEAGQRTDREEIAQALEEKRENRQKSSASRNPVLVRNSQANNLQLLAYICMGDRDTN
jgi:hypothetical protein